MNTFTLIGGDLRQKYLGEALTQRGHRVYLWHPEDGTDYEPLVADAEIVVLPLPVSGLPEEFLKELFPKLRGKIVLGGMVSAFVKALGQVSGVPVYDYYDSETVQVLNAIPTAEGAIALAIGHRHKTLWGSTCLVLGYGRIGKQLSLRLRALGARVIVAARKESDLALAGACGCETVALKQLYEVLSEAEVVYNTIPASCMDRSRLTLLEKDALLIELASAPGGFDREAVNNLGLTLIPAGGLPGKVAPKTAGEILLTSILHILEHRKEEDV